MLNLFHSTGVLALPLAVCLLLAVAIILERFWVLRISSVAPTERMSYLCGVIGESDALEKLRQTYDGNPLQRLLIVALANEMEGKKSIREAVAHESTLIAYELERFLSLLGSIAIISPLLGLLGTVVGMIEVFDTILNQGTGIAPSLAGGISTALLTTAMGISIAIPALLFSRFFHRRIDGLLVKLETTSSSILEQYRNL